MKLSLKGWLMFLWTLFNVFNLICIGRTYNLAGHYFENAPSRTDVSTIASYVSREKLEALYMYQDLAIRGLENTVYALVKIWLVVILSNILIIISYPYLLKRKTSSPGTSTP